jgi:hypothetical protein
MSCSLLDEGINSHRDALAAYAAEQLPEDASFSAENVVQHSQMIQENSGSVEQAIEDRKAWPKGLDP